MQYLKILTKNLWIKNYCGNTILVRVRREIRYLWPILLRISPWRLCSSLVICVAGTMHSTFLQVDPRH